MSLGTFSSGVESFRNVPLAVRQVPIHPRDYPPGQIRTIPFDAIANESFKDGFWRMAVGSSFRLWRARVALGVAYEPFANQSRGFPIADFSDAVPEDKPLREWSQWGESNHRGYGAALVYYRNSSKRSAVRPFVEGEFQFFRSKWVGVAGFFGRRSERYSVTFSSGWDRFNALEEWREYDPILVSVPYSYGGVRLQVLEEGGEFLIDFGISRSGSPSISLSDDLKGVEPELHSSGGLFLNVSLRLYLSKIK